MPDQKNDPIDQIMDIYQTLPEGARDEFVEFAEALATDPAKADQMLEELRQEVLGPERAPYTPAVQSNA